MLQPIKIEHGVFKSPIKYLLSNYRNSSGESQKYYSVLFPYVFYTYYIYVNYVVLGFHINLNYFIDLSCIFLM